jgi:hypothetical protein
MRTDPATLSSQTSQQNSSLYGKYELPKWENICGVSALTHTSRPTYSFCYRLNGRRDSGSLPASLYGLGDHGSTPGRGRDFFSPLLCPDRLWGPPSLLSNGYRGLLSLGSKLLRGEANHSHSSSTEIKNAWGAITPLPQYAFMAWCLVKHRDFIFLPFCSVNRLVWLFLLVMKNSVYKLSNNQLQNDYPLTRLWNIIPK